MKRKVLFKSYIFIFIVLVLFTAINVQGIGYTYDHNMAPIYSTEGMTVNRTPYIYSDLGLESPSRFSNPKDLFVFKEGNKSIIYLIDGGQGGANPATLYTMDDSFKITAAVEEFFYNPNKISDEKLKLMYSDGHAVINQGKTPNANASTDGWGFASLEDLKKETKVKLVMKGASSIHRGLSTNEVPHTDYLYISDTENHQVLILSAKDIIDVPDAPGSSIDKKTFEVIDVVIKPVDELGLSGDDAIKFNPSKVINDAAGRIYVISSTVTAGIMQFSKQGSFDRYVGTNYVTLSPWDVFWRKFATAEQLKKYETLLNTSFTSMVYKNNMVYTTSYAIDNGGALNSESMIKKINPSAKDVIRKNGYLPPKGDYIYTMFKDGKGAYGPSQFVGITVNDYGVYTVADTNRGRLFTYDNEGNLLYISGGSGTQIDKISKPVAIQYYGEQLLVLDSAKKAILVFEPTKIARYINKAVQCEYIGKDDGEYIYKYDTNGNVISKVYEKGAYDYWEEVIKLNSNYEYAYVGIGKHYKNNKDYKKAMEYFELGAEKRYYGKSYKEYRDIKIRKYFPTVVITIVALVVGKQVLKVVLKKKKKREAEAK